MARAVFLPRPLKLPLAPTVRLDVLRVAVTRAALLSHNGRRLEPETFPEISQESEDRRDSFPRNGYPRYSTTKVQAIRSRANRCAAPNPNLDSGLTVWDAKAAPSPLPCLPLRYAKWL